MKKILLFLSSLVLALSLASCDSANKKHTVTYTDENGKETEVEIAKTEDKEQIKGILVYLTQKSATTEITGVEANLNVKVNAKGRNDAEYIDMNGDLNLKASQSKGLSAKLNANAIYSDEQGKQDMNISGNAYLETANIISPSGAYLYADFNITSENVAEINTSGKYKISMVNLLEYLQNMSSSMPSLPISVATTTEPSVPSVDELVSMFDTYLPNSKYYISAVTDDELSLSFDLALKDILALSNTPVDTDSIISFEFKFLVESGLCSGLNANLDLLELIKAVQPSTSSEDVSQFTASISLSVNYDANVQIDTLAESEKANYIEYDPNTGSVNTPNDDIFSQA